MLYSFLVMNFRNRFVLVLNLILPIVFMLLFGSVFGTQGSGPKIFYYSDRNLSIDDKSWTKIEQEPKSIEEIKNIRADVVVIAKNGKIDVYYLTTISQFTPEITLFRNMYLSAKGEKSIFEIAEHKLELSKELSGIEYIMIGVISISLLSIGMNAGVSIFSTYVRYGLFNRFNVTPVKPLTILISSTSAQIITGFISSALILVLSKIVYKANLFVKLNYVPLFLLVVISSVMLNLSVGVLLSLFFKKAAQSVSSLLYTIFIFFSGVYFPITYLPKYLRIVSYFLPPRYVHMLFQKVYGVDSLNNFSFVLLNIIFIILGLSIGSFATRKFLKTVS